MAMVSLTARVRCDFINLSFVATSLALLLILFIRVTRGLDLTDEMQYYGEIKGLIETGRLFSNDLFIQQSVYILFYPIFLIYHSIFGFEGLVFFGRLLMAALSFLVFLYAYQKFLELNFSSLMASLTSLCLTFAIPYHGIFAPSYNTVSQVLWIIFTILFFEWRWRGPISWAVIPVVTAFAHPTAAVLMSLLILMRFSFERNLKRVATVTLFLLGGGLVALPIIIYFATPQEYFDSLMFSSGFSVVDGFFQSKYQPVAMLAIDVMFVFGLLFGIRFRRLPISLLACIVIAVAIVVFLVTPYWFGYGPKLVFILSILSALAYCWILSNASVDNKELRLRAHWLVLLLLSFATTIAVTSSNGLGQATGAFMVGLPLLLGVAVTSGTTDKNFGSIIFQGVASIALLLTLLVVQWSLYPYLESRWWQAKQPIQSVPEFKFISTSFERAVLIQRVRHGLKSMVQGKRILIISDLPGLYFAVGAQPETCMLYMHSLTSDKSEEALLKCLSKKNPEIVIDLLAEIAKDDSRIKKTLRRYYSRRGLNCINEMIKIDSRDGNNPDHLRYAICM